MKNEDTRNTTVLTIKCLLQVHNNNKLTKKTDREESSEEEDRQLQTEISEYVVFVLFQF